MMGTQATEFVKNLKPRLFTVARLYVCLWASLFVAVTDGFAQTPVTVAANAGGTAATDSVEGTKPTVTEGSNRTHIITMSNKHPTYSPQNLVIELGDVVKWVNSEQSDSHSVHERTGVMISPDVPAGKDWCYQFTSEGEYTYTCRIHPWMRGRIVVKARDVNMREVELPGDWSSQATTFLRSGAALWLAGPNALLPLETNPEARLNAPLLLPAQAGANSSSFVSADTLWLLDLNAGSLHAYNLSSHQLRRGDERKLPGKVTAAAATPAGNVWLFDSSSGNFVSLDAATGQPSLLKHVKLSSPPAKMLAGDAGKLAFIAQSREHIGIFDPSSGEVLEFALPPGADLSDIAAAPDGLFWVSDAGRNKIIKVEKGWLTEYTVPTSFSSPRGLVVDAEGGVWFAEPAANKIGLLREGRFAEYNVPAPDGRPTGVGIDAQGNVWFVQSGAGKLGLIQSATARALSSAVGAPHAARQQCVQPEPPRPDVNRPRQHTGGVDVKGHRHNQD